MEDFRYKNAVTLIGTARAEPTFSHTNRGDRFVHFPLAVSRLSGEEDELVVLLPERLAAQCLVEQGKRFGLTGQLRSFNNRSGEGRKLILSVFAQSIFPCGEADCNEILLQGAICKPPVRRRTPLGREICDVLLAVNRYYGRADYIPCIAWGRTAAAVGKLQVGDPLGFCGRIQSRSYLKRTERGEERRVAYEVSIMKLYNGALE